MLASQMLRSPSNNHYSEHRGKPDASSLEVHSCSADIITKWKGGQSRNHMASFLASTLKTSESRHYCIQPVQAIFIASRALWPLKETWATRPWPSSVLPSHNKLEVENMNTTEFKFQIRCYECCCSQHFCIKYLFYENWEADFQQHSGKSTKSTRGHLCLCSHFDHVLVEREHSSEVMCLLP